MALCLWKILVFSMTGLYDLYSLLLALTVLAMRFPTFLVNAYQSNRET